VSERLAALTERFLKTHLDFHPVDASFMGIDGYDHRLPSADEDAVEWEMAALLALEADLANSQPASTPAERLEGAALGGQVRLARRELEERPRYLNPTWYSGEAAFGLVSLLLPSDPPRRREDLRERLEAMPGFLAAGARRLRGRALPADWVKRARQECDALVLLLERGLPRHDLWNEQLAASARTAAVAVTTFAGMLDENHPEADPACGEAMLDFLVRDVHHLPYTAAEAEALAIEGFERTRAELARMAAELDPQRSAVEQLRAIEGDHPPLDRVVASYGEWNERALAAAEAAGLVTPARDYGLSFRTLPDWAREVAGALYFLFYRSPPAGRPASGSTYWVFPPGEDTAAYLRGQNTATIKITHVVHHGSIGHHTQNARARDARSRLGQLAGTDCASGIAFLSGGTMVEGWACYVQDLMLEAEDFYTPLERLLLKQYELRNAATCLADLRLHSGRWKLDDLRRFYAEEAGFAPGRIWGETTRNSIYPGTRLMYWLGTREIKRLRAELRPDPRPFHDELIGYGSVPVALVAGEMRRAHAAREN
jgi:hypothetical protein